MKKINSYFLLLLSTLLLNSLLCKSQNLLFEENFGNPVSGTLIQDYSGWQNTEVAYTGDGTCDLRTTSPSNGYPNASGDGNVMLNNDTKWFLISNLNTLGYDSLKLRIGLRKNSISENGSNFCVEVSEDSNSWKRFSTFDLLPTGSGTTGWYYLSFDSIPSCQNLHIKFSNLGNSDFRLDDLSIVTSTEIPESQVATPNILPNGGIYSEPVLVSLTSNTEHATIYYTLNGDIPDENSQLYSTPFQISHSCLLKAIGYKTGLANSEVISTLFTIRDNNTFITLPFDISTNSSAEQQDITLMDGFLGVQLGVSYNDGSVKFEQSKAGSASLTGYLNNSPDTLIFSVKGRKGGSAPQGYEGIRFDILESSDNEEWQLLLSLNEEDINTSSFTSFQVNCSPDTRYIKWFLHNAEKGNTQLNDIRITKFQSPGGVDNSIANSPASSFKLFPNPTSSYLHIINPEERITYIEILNSNGIPVLRKYINQHNCTLEISHLSNGIYFIRIRTERGVAIKKLMKE